MSSPTLALSLGGGTQSGCMSEQIVLGVLPRPDAVVFADTGGEMPGTYGYIEYLRERLATVNVPLVIASAGNLERDIIAKAGRGMQPTPPVRVRTESGKLERINAYTCSYDYKRRVIEREVKRLCGGRGAWKRSNVVQWIGYSRDEAGRLKQPLSCRCGHLLGAHYDGQCQVRLPERPAGRCGDGCMSFDPWQQNVFPLIDMRMTRRDCQRWLTERDLPLPPRSACFFCPNRGNEHWRDLRDNHPDLWARAIELDTFVRHGLNKLDGTAYLHQSGVPLELADLRTAGQVLSEDHGQDALFDEAEVANDCDAGVCFT